MLLVITRLASGRPLQERRKTCFTGFLLCVLLAALLAIPAAADAGDPPVANFSANTTSGFVPMTVQFTDTSTGTAPLSYEWDFGDGSPNGTVQDPVHTYTGGGTYTVTLTVSDSVGNSTLERPGYIDAVQVPPLGGSKGYFLVHSNVDGAAVYFNGDSFEGYIENGTLQVQICLTCTPIRTFTVEKCGYFALTQNITQYPGINETVDLYANLTAPKEPLIAEFTTNVTSGFVPLTVGFTSSGIGIAQAWNWSFGDGTYSEEENPVHTYTAGGNYTVSLYENNSACQNGTVVKENYIDAVQIPPLGGSKGYFLIHSNVDGAAVYFNSDNFEGYIENGTLLVQICLTCTPIRTFTVEKCGYFALTQNITQYPGINETVDLYANLTAPREPLIWDFTANVTSGSVPLTVGFTSSGIGIAQAWNWSFGDGTYSGERNPVHTYEGGGVYTVSLQVSNSACQNSTVVKEDYISVEGPPLFKADFTVSPVFGVVPLTVHCTDHSTGNPTMIVYNFGDGFTATGGDVFHTYRLPGTYTITETISKYDAATGVFLKSVARKPDAVTGMSKPVPILIAAFSASPESGMVPLRVTFTDESFGNPTYYSYDFGDGFTSSSKNPVHTYLVPGVYEVKLTVLKVDPGSGSLLSSDTTGTIVVTGHR